MRRWNRVFISIILFKNANFHRIYCRFRPYCLTEFKYVYFLDKLGFQLIKPTNNSENLNTLGKLSFTLSFSHSDNHRDLDCMK